MWTTNGNELKMVEGDYGIKLPVTVHEIPMSASDSMRMTFKTRRNGDVILEKEFSDIQNNVFYLEFTEDETNLFPVGQYVYSMDWYQNGIFMCNVIPIGALKVVDKA